MRARAEASGGGRAKHYKKGAGHLARPLYTGKRICFDRPDKAEAILPALSLSYSSSASATSAAHASASAIALTTSEEPLRASPAT